MNYSLHREIDKVFDTGDIRPLYGIPIPLLICVGVIGLFGVWDAWWMLGVAMFAVLSLAALVVWGISRMLGEEEPDEIHRAEPARSGAP
jgi:hypothetical protein